MLEYKSAIRFDHVNAMHCIRIRRSNIFAIAKVTLGTIGIRTLESRFYLREQYHHILPSLDGNSFGL